MGKVDLGINLAKDVATSLKTGSRSLLWRQPSIFRGINPTLTYPPTGKTFALPRFCSVEMRQARQMNKIASQQIKAPVNSTFSKASAEDLRRLTSETIEDSYSRVQWTNPKDGKVYNLLKQGETEDGKVLIRILDQDGAFIKEAELTPKKIIIMDDFSSGKNIIQDSSTMFETMTHGDIVSLLAKRHNPYANIELIDINSGNHSKTVQNFYSQFEKLQKRIDSGEKIDFLSLSLGIPKKNKECAEILKKLNITPFELKTSAVSFNHPNITSYPASAFAYRNKGNIRIIQGSANAGKNNTNIWLTYPEIEGCGSLNPYTGKIANFSASRNSLYTQHYENGIFEFIPKPNGLSLTGKYNIDVQLKPELKDTVSKYIGKTPIKTTAEENRRLYSLKQQAKEKYSLKLEELKTQYTSSTEKTQIKEIENQMSIARKNKDKDTFIKLQTQLTEIKNNIYKKISPLMDNFVCDETIAYKNFVKQLKQENKVIWSGFAGEYHIPNENPLALQSEIAFQTNKEGFLELQIPRTDNMGLSGTSFSTPIRTAKLALNDMMEGIL